MPCSFCDVILCCSRESVPHQHTPLAARLITKCAAQNCVMYTLTSSKNESQLCTSASSHGILPRCVYQELREARHSTAQL